MSLLEKHRGKIVDIRPRRFIGILERALLGTAMSVVLSVIERRMNRRSTSVVRETPIQQPEEERRAT